MRRTLAAVALLLTAALARAAEDQPDEILRLTVSPAAAPTPSLKYRLLPDRRDLAPGNAAALYYRSLAMFTENRYLLADFQEDHWDRWFIAPLKELPLKEAGEKVGAARNLLREVELAGRCRQCDWELEGRPERTGLLSPDVRGFRRVAVVLGVRARYDIASAHFPEAVQSLQTGYALARHLGAGPTLNHLLAGEVAANLMTVQLEELAQQPGAPNLYWALAVLPRPFFDPQLALQEEGTRLERTWPGLRRLGEGTMTVGQVKAVRQEIQKTLDEFGVPAPGEKAVEEAHAAAKQALREQGLPAEQVEAMPPFQAVGLHALREYRAAWEEYAKWFALPGGWRDPGCRKSADRYRDAAARLDKLVLGGLVRHLEIGDPAAIEKLFGAMDRLDRKLAALRAVEALRLHAAARGRLPAALADVTEAPIPADPLTGKPFIYEVTADGARLVTPSLTVEITLRR